MKRAIVHAMSGERRAVLGVLVALLITGCAPRRESPLPARAGTLPTPPSLGASALVAQSPASPGSASPSPSADLTRAAPNPCDNNPSYWESAAKDCSTPMDPSGASFDELFRDHCSHPSCAHERSSHPACARARQRALSVFQRLPEIDHCGSAGAFHPNRPFGPCFASSDGSGWVVWIESAHTEGKRDPSLTPERRSCRQSVRGAARLTHVTASGQLLHGPRIRLVEDGFQSSRFFNQPNQPPRAFDYDGDGISEVVFLHGNHNELQLAGVWTVRQGRVVPYAPAPQGLLGTVDADCDGRPDLLVDAPFVWGTCGSLIGCSQNAPKLLAHSLPDGTFSLDDEVAREWARGQCPCSKLPELVPEAAETSPQAPLLKTRCALLWGHTATDLLPAIQRRCPPSQRQPTAGMYEQIICTSLDDFLEVTPPLILRASSP